MPSKVEEDKIKDEVKNRKTKAVALLSGGLDSSLAVRMMLEQGV
jgi:asparagine synthetase B (glutamine-hydrolysing)